MKNKRGSQSDSRWERFKNWMSRHKVMTALLALVLVVVVVGLAALLLIFWMVSSQGVSRLSYDSVPEATAPSSPSFFESPGVARRDVGVETDKSIDVEEGMDPDDIPGVEIKEAELRVESDQAVADEERVRDITRRYNGYVEESRKSEDDRRIRVNMVARVPAGSFDEFLLDLREELELEEYNISDYRIETAARETELEIIREMQVALEEIRQETMGMERGEERIRLLEDVVEKQRRYRQQEENILQQLDEVRYRGKLATVSITITEDVKPSLWPEDLGDRFRERVKNMIEEVVIIGMELLTSTLVLLLTVVQWLIYVLVVVIPVWIVARLIWRVFKKFHRE